MVLSFILCSHSFFILIGCQILCHIHLIFQNSKLRLSNKESNRWSNYSISDNSVFLLTWLTNTNTDILTSQCQLKSWFPCCDCIKIFEIKFNQCWKEILPCSMSWSSERGKNTFIYCEPLLSEPACIIKWSP